MKVHELKREMDEGFARVDRRFDTLEGRFGTLEQRFHALEERFGALEQRVLQEGETTRRHFDVIAEQLRTELRLSLDRSLATSTQMATLEAVNTAEHAGFSRMLDDHESRLAKHPRT